MALPTESNLTSAGTTNAQMKTYLAGMRNFIANLLGTTETVGDARVALGAGTVGDALFTAETAADAHEAMPIQSGTAVSASGTAIDFTSIPSWAKRVTLMLSGISVNGTSNPLFQIGDSGGAETTGYTGSATGGGNNASPSCSLLSTGFQILSGSAGNVLEGQLVLTLVDPDTNTWSAAGNFAHSAAAAAYYLIAGTKSLSAPLDRVRLTTVGGTNSFDAGVVNIFYE
jgi:hypothetical protein